MMKAKISKEIKKIWYTHGYVLLDDGKIRKTNESILLIHLEKMTDKDRLRTFMQSFFADNFTAIDFVSENSSL